MLVLPPRPRAIPPIVENYAAAREAFSWEALAREMGVELDGPFNLGALALRAPADRVALVWHGANGEEEKYTYGQIAQAAARVAGMIQNLGLSRGDRVLFLARALPETVTGVLGALLFGAVPCVLTPGRNVDYLRNVVQRSGARMLVLEPDSKPMIDAIRKDAPDLWHVVVLQRASLAAKMGAGDFLWNDYVDAAKPVFDAAPCLPEAPAFLHYTELGMSGAVAAQLAALALRNSARAALDVREGDRCLFLTRPGEMHYIPYGILAPLLAGATQVLVEDSMHFPGYAHVEADVCYAPFHALETILRHVPALASLLVRARHIAVAQPADRGFLVMSSVSFGSALHSVWWDRACGSIALAELPGADLRPGSLGRPIPGVDVSVIDGHVAVKVGPGAPFLEFWKEPRLTQHALRDGWLVTAQKGKADSEGWIWPA